MEDSDVQKFDRTKISSNNIHKTGILGWWYLSQNTIPYSQ
jgi:hypothetical protein